MSIALAMAGLNCIAVIIFLFILKTIMKSSICIILFKKYSTLYTAVFASKGVRVLPGSIKCNWRYHSSFISNYYNDYINMGTC